MSEASIEQQRYFCLKKAYSCKRSVLISNGLISEDHCVICCVPPHFQELIDFGLLPSGADPRSVKLLLLNSGSKPIPVQNVIATPVTDAVDIAFSPQKVPADTLRPTVIAEVTFDREWQCKKSDGVWPGPQWCFDQTDPEKFCALARKV